MFVTIAAMKASTRVAIVYDRVNKFGGAERVLLALKKMYPKSVLFTSVFDEEAATWVGDWEIRTSFLQKIPFAKSHHEWFAPLMPLAFETLNFTGYDLIISVTSEFAKNVITTSNQLHVCYCLTPTRYLWSHTHEYALGNFSFLKQVIFSSLRRIDFQAAQRPQAFFSISNRVKKRISLYYRRQSSVLYPPSTFLAESRAAAKRGKYYLVVSRLVPYKHVELAIAACIKNKSHLRIVGSGSDGLRLLSLAENSPYVHFEGNVTDQKLNKLYLGALALICPQEEDFGLVALESQLHGVPVVSFKNSGVAETVLDGKTGILFTDQAVDSLCLALNQCEKVKWNRGLIRRNVLRFSEKSFELSFKREIAKLLRKHYS